MIAAFVALLAAAAPKPAAPAKAPPPTLLVVPFHVVGEGAKDSAWIGVAAAEQLLGRANASKALSWLSLRQLNAVLKRRDQTLEEVSGGAQLFQLSAAMGASHAIAGKITAGGPTVRIEALLVTSADGQVVDSAEAEAPPDKLAAAFAQIGDKLFTALKIKGKGPPPPTGDPAAMKAGVACIEKLLPQPLGPRARPVLPAEDVDEARMFCEAALKADKKYPLARAGLALVRVNQGDAKKGLQEARAAGAGGKEPLAALVEYYALSQMDKPKDAVGALEKAVKANPGFLHARGYIGEHYNVNKEYAKALKAFEEYLGRCPGHPWVRAQIGYSKARMGNVDAAIDTTADALASDMDNAEIAIELASRLIDAGKLEEAAVAVGTALAATPPRPLAHLRLGYIRLLQGKLDDAIPALQRAIADAKQADEFRTRGIAHYDLGRVFARQGKKDAALAELEASRKEGHPPVIGCAEPDLASLAAEPRFTKLCKKDAK
jgi:tetratricopeptide (TPR) repeat protein